MSFHRVIQATAIKNKNVKGRNFLGSRLLLPTVTGGTGTTVAGNVTRGFLGSRFVALPNEDTSQSTSDRPPVLSLWSNYYDFFIG